MNEEISKLRNIVKEHVKCQQTAGEIRVLKNIKEHIYKIKVIKGTGNNQKRNIVTLRGKSQSVKVSGVSLE